MVTKAYITEIPADGNNLYKVNIPIMSDNTGGDAIFNATLCTMDSYLGLSVGDCVFVCFEDDEENDAIILGKLYVTVPSNSKSFIITNDFTATGDVNLPVSTKFGKYTASDFINSYNHSTDIDGTYSSTTKDYSKFTIPAVDKEKWLPVKDSEGNILYYIYTMASSEGIVPEGREEYHRIFSNIASVDTDIVPIWDIVVDPTSISIPYKTQIKYRAWCTTLNTGNGYMELISMKVPEHDIILGVKGL